MPHINVSSQTTLLNPAHFFVFALYDASSPTVLLESIAPAKPYGNPLQVTFTYNCVNGHIYIIKLWESIDTSPTGTVRNQLAQTIGLNSINVRMPEYWEVDVTTDLTSGQSSFVKADLENWDFTIERVGQGTMTPQSAADVTVPKYKRTNSDTSPNDLGPRIELLTVDDVFQPNENFVVFFVPQIIVAAPGGTPSDPISSGRIITADESLTNVDLSQALMIRAAANKITIELPPLSTVADFRFMYLYSCGGSHNNAVFATQGSDTIDYPSGQTSIILGQNEILKIYKAFGAWQVDNDLFGVKMVGELLYNYFQTEINTLLCAGQLLNRDEYPRLWAWVQTLEAGVVVSDATWTGTFVMVDGVAVYTKKYCFSTGDISGNTFRMPLLTNAMLKGVDGSARIPSSLQNEQGLIHQHEGVTGTHITPLFGRGPTRLVGKYNGTGSGFTDLASPPVSSAGAVLTRWGNENLVRNAGAYLLIRC